MHARFNCARALHIYINSTCVILRPTVSISNSSLLKCGIEDASKARIVCRNTGGNGVKRSARATVSLVRFDSKRLVRLSSVAPATREVGASPWRRRWKVLPRNRMLKPRHIDLRVASPLSLSLDCHTFFFLVCTSPLREIDYENTRGKRKIFLTEEKVGVSLDRDASRRKRLPCRSFSPDAFTIPRLFSLNSTVSAAG